MDPCYMDFGEVDSSALLIGRKRGVYTCTSMCASACVTPSNIVYLWYGYRSTGISVVEYRDWLLNIILI